MRPVLEEQRLQNYKGTFTVFYKQFNKGRLFNFREGRDPKYRFEFPDSDTPINTSTLSDKTMYCWVSS